MDGAAAAAITGAFGVILLLVSQRRTRKVVKEVHDEVRTNDGQRAGERIEDIGAALTALANGIAEMGQALAETLAAHTESDTENFEELRTMLKVQNETAAERIALSKKERSG